MLCLQHAFYAGMFRKLFNGSFGMKAKTSLKIGSVPSIFPFQEPKNERVSSQSRIQKQNNLLKKVETEQV